MKIRLMLLMFCVMAITPAVFAQDNTTINLFQPTMVTQSPASTTTSPFTYGTTNLSLVCPLDGSAYAQVTGANGGGFIADNFLTVNGTNICPGGGSCFTRTNQPFPAIGQPVDAYYTPVGPIDLLSYLTATDGRYTFNLVDAQFSNLSQNVYGNSEINLVTNCQIGYPVCHKNNGKGKNGQFNTLYVDSQNAVNAHVKQHDGDYAGVCTTTTTTPVKTR